MDCGFVLGVVSVVQGVDPEKPIYCLFMVMTLGMEILAAMAAKLIPIILISWLIRAFVLQVDIVLQRHAHHLVIRC